MSFNPFRTQSSVSNEETEMGIRSYIADGVCSITQVGLQGGMFLTAFALFLGASKTQIGILAAIGFLSQVMQLPGLLMVGWLPSRRGITFLSAGLSRLAWLPILCMAFYGLLSVNVMLSLLIVSAFIGAIAGPAWNSLIRETIPEERLGAINGKRNRLGLSLAMVATLSAGFFLDTIQKNAPEWTGASYAGIFSLGFIFAMTGLWGIYRIPEKDQSQMEKPKLGALLKAPLKDKNFVMLISFLSLITFVLSMVSPFFTVYLLKRLDISMLMLTILGIASQLSNIFFFKVFGLLIDKLSNKSVLSVCIPIFLSMVVMWCFTTLPEKHKYTMHLLFVIQIISGCALAGITLGTQNLTLKLSPKGMAHGRGRLGGFCGGGFRSIHWRLFDGSHRWGRAVHAPCAENGTSTVYFADYEFSVVRLSFYSFGIRRACFSIFSR
jgi:MFS family permease